jgi:hypothetical protein
MNNPVQGQHSAVVVCLAVFHADAVGLGLSVCVLDFPISSLGWYLLSRTVMCDFLLEERISHFSVQSSVA